MRGEQVSVYRRGPAASSGGGGVAGGRQPSAERAPQLCVCVRACVRVCACACVQGERVGGRERDREERQCELHKKPHLPPPTFVLAQGAVALSKQQPRRAVLVVRRRHLTQAGTDTQSQVHYLHENFGPTARRIFMKNSEMSFDEMVEAVSTSQYTCTHSPSILLSYNWTNSKENISRLDSKLVVTKRTREGISPVAELSPEHR